MGCYLLRKRGGGRNSCKAIAERSQLIKGIWRQDRRMPREVGAIIRWGVTDDVNLNAVVFNNARAIAQTSNKKWFRMKLNEAKLAPKTWDRVGDVEYPCVVRPGHHTGGEHFYPCQDQRELEQAMRRCGNSLYISKLIDKAAEYRVFVVQGRVACVAQKTPPPNVDGKAAWNHTNGAVFQNVRFNDWPLRAVRVAVEGFNLSELDFGAVDVIVGKDGEAYVLEINTAPALESEYRATSLARCFDWMIEKGKDRIDVVKAKGGALKWIHPALTANAKMPVVGVQG